MTPEQVEQLKAKYPLAFDTIKLPVRYDETEQMVRDDRGRWRARIKRIGKGSLSQELKRKHQIGELICELLNQLQ